MKTNSIGQSLECPQTFDMEFARRLIVHLGGDATPVEDNWCWADLRQLPDFDRLLPLMMDYFEHATTGNPSWAAYQLHTECGAPLDWAKRIVENDTTGNPSGAAHWLHRDCGAPLVWAQRVIENDTTGNPSWFAYLLHGGHGVPLDWAQRIVENATTGNPSQAAYWLHIRCDVPLDWVKRVVENATTGNPSEVAYWLHKNCGAPLEWAQRIVENDTTGNPSQAAYCLHTDCGAPLDWAQQVEARYAMKANAISNTASFLSGRRPAARANGRLFSSDDVAWHAAVIEGRIWFFGLILLAGIVLAWKMIR